MWGTDIRFAFLNDHSGDGENGLGDGRMDLRRSCIKLLLLPGQEQGVARPEGGGWDEGESDEI